MTVLGYIQAPMVSYPCGGYHENHTNHSHTLRQNGKIQCMVMPLLRRFLSVLAQTKIKQLFFCCLSDMKVKLILRRVLPDAQR